MRSLRLVLPLTLLLLLAALGFPVPRVLAATVSFAALTQGTFHTPGGDPILSVQVVHPSVSGAPFALASLVADQTVDLAAAPSTLAATFTFTNTLGNKLYGTWRGTAVPGTNEGALISDGTFNFSGGTGSFAGASGCGTYRSQIQFTGANDGTSSIEWTGTLSGPNLLEGTTGSVETKVTIKAGTAFNLSPVFDTNGAPVFPWQHEVRGIVQVSHLGNGTVAFKVGIDSGAACAGGHNFCLSGTMTITTLAGDKLEANVVGWAQADPNDPKQTPSMYSLYYAVTITGGTGKLAGARGQGEVTGAFNFTEPFDPKDLGDPNNSFCDGYAGVATWQFEGAVVLPNLALNKAGAQLTLQAGSDCLDQLQIESSADLKAWTPMTNFVNRLQIPVTSDQPQQFFRAK